VLELFGVFAVIVEVLTGVPALGEEVLKVRHSYVFLKDGISAIVSSLN
jgi:hypothetical protein